MGWETIEPHKRGHKGDRVTLAAYVVRSKTGTVSSAMTVLAVPLKVAMWDAPKKCILLRGNDEHAGKIAIKPDENGAHSARRVKGRFLISFKASIAEHTAERVPYEWDGGMLVITLPAWALAETRKPEKPGHRPAKAPAKRIAYTEPAKPVPEPVPTILPAEQSALADWQAKIDAKKEAKRPSRLPSTAEPIANVKRRDPEPVPTKSKDWSPDAVHQRDHTRTMPIGNTLAKADRHTIEARKLPQSKASHTEIPPAWRGKPGDISREQLVARTDKADISIAGAYLMIGRTPTTVPKHLRPALALLIDRFGEAVSLDAIGAISEKKVVIEEMAKLVRPRFAIVVDKNQCLLTEG